MKNCRYNSRSLQRSFVTIDCRLYREFVSKHKNKTTKIRSRTNESETILIKIMIRLKINLFYSIIFTLIIFSYILPAETVFVRTYTISTVIGVPGSSTASPSNLPGTSTYLSTPYGIWISTNGRLYIADSGVHVIRTVDTTLGRQAPVTVLAGLINNAGSTGDGGFASNARLSTPSGVCGDTAGNIYIMDSGNLQIRKVDTLGFISIVSGRTGTSGCVDGGVGLSNFINPFTCQVDQNGDVLILDSGCHCIRRLSSATNILTTIIGTLGLSGSNEGIGTNAKLNAPRGFFLDSNGNFFIADSGNNRIRKFPATLATSTTIAGSANGGGNNVVASSLVNLFSAPQGIWCNRLGNRFITDAGNHWIREINGTNNIITAPVGAGADSAENIIALGARVRTPVSIIGDSLGNIYFSDSQDWAVRKLTLGAPISPFPTFSPSFAPTRTPTAPTPSPTATPTRDPTFAPTVTPTRDPTTKTPSFLPSTVGPSFVPTPIPTRIPSAVPSKAPTVIPTALPTLLPVASPTSSPIPIPTFAPTRVPTATPTAVPVTTPSRTPSPPPSNTPIATPTRIPTKTPSAYPSKVPTLEPTFVATFALG
jgi:sugar lactone lactonase YvrE